MFLLGGGVGVGVGGGGAGGVEEPARPPTCRCTSYVYMRAMCCLRDGTQLPGWKFVDPPHLLYLTPSVHPPPPACPPGVPVNGAVVLYSGTLLYSANPADTTKPVSRHSPATQQAVFRSLDVGMSLSDVAAAWALACQDTVCWESCRRVGIDTSASRIVPLYNRGRRSSGAAGVCACVWVGVWVFRRLGLRRKSNLGPRLPTWLVCVPLVAC